MLAEARFPFIDEFVMLKYSGFESVISTLSQALREIERECWMLKYDRLLQRNELWLQAYSDLALEVNSQYTEPRRTAREKISRILSTEDENHHAYTKLKEKMDRQSRELYEIYNMLKDFARIPEIPIKWRTEAIRRASKLRFLKIETDNLTHSLRRSVRTRNTYSNPFVLSRAMGYLLTTRRRISVDGDNLIAGMLTGRGPHYEEVFDYRGPIRNFYIEKLKQPNRMTRESMMQVEQLNIIAPFETVVSDMLALIQELQYLQLSLRAFYPAWTRVDKATRSRIGEEFYQWTLKWATTTRSIISLYSELVTIDWMRMLHERKLKALGEPSLIKQLGLFQVRHPISQDLVRFNEWSENVESTICGSIFLGIVRRCSPLFWRKVDAILFATQSMEKRTTEPRPQLWTGIQANTSQQAGVDTRRAERSFEDSISRLLKANPKNTTPHMLAPIDVSPSKAKRIKRAQRIKRAHSLWMSAIPTPTPTATTTSTLLSRDIQRNRRKRRGRATTTSSSLRKSKGKQISGTREGRKRKRKNKKEQL